MNLLLQFFPRFIKLKRPLCDRYALLFSIAIVWIYAEILTSSGAFKKSKQLSCRTDSSGLIRSAPWYIHIGTILLQFMSYFPWRSYNHRAFTSVKYIFRPLMSGRVLDAMLSPLMTCRFYIPFPFQWGPPTFTAGETFAAMIASFVALIEVLNLSWFINKSFHIPTKLHFLAHFFSNFHYLSWQSSGSFIAAARYGSATPVPPSVISRGVGWLVSFHATYAMHATWYMKISHSSNMLASYLTESDCLCVYFRGSELCSTPFLAVSPALQQ